MALPTALPTGRSTCIVKACSLRIKTYGKYPLGYRHRLRCRQAKRVELLRADNGARSAATCIFEVAVPRKPLTCLKMAVSSLFMRRGGRDCGTASSAALSNLATKTDPKLGPPGGPKKRGRGIISNSKAFPYCDPKNGSGFMIFNFFWDMYKNLFAFDFKRPYAAFEEQASISRT